jgi:HD-like signal output (HDOD) protein
MAELGDQAMKDMSALAIERVRKAVMSVGQLVEDDDQRAALMITLALDLVRGAAVTLAEVTGRPEREERAFVVAQLLTRLGGVGLLRDLMRMSSAEK